MLIYINTEFKKKKKLIMRIFKSTTLVVEIKRLNMTLAICLLFRNTLLYTYNILNTEHIKTLPVLIHKLGYRSFNRSCFHSPMSVNSFMTKTNPLVDIRSGNTSLSTSVPVSSVTVIARSSGIENFSFTAKQNIYEF